MLSCSDYSSVTRNLFTAIELRGNDYSSVTRKSLHGREIGKIGCFARGEACVRAVRATRASIPPDVEEPVRGCSEGERRSATRDGFHGLAPGV